MKTITTEGWAALVEHEGRRVIVPVGKADDPTVLAQGIPFGCPWEEMIVLQATPQKLADELRRRGIWTADDLLARPQVALGAIQAVYGLDLATLIQAARHFGGG